MKDLVFLTHSMSFGGAERVMSILMNEFVDRNYRVSLIYLNDTPIIAYPLSDKVNKFFIRGIRFNSITNFLNPINEIRNLLKKIKPDVIVSFFNDSSCFSWLAQLGLNIPIVFSERNDPNNNIKGFKAQFIQKIALTTASKIVFQTQGAKSCYKSRYIQNKSTIIYNPINICQKEVHISDDNFKLVTVGRLSYQKNQNLLLVAMNKLKRKYPQLTLTIYGEGYLRGNLEQQIKELELENKVFLPGIESNVIDKLSEFRMFVFSSNYEGIPNALLEAMSIGLPCVSTDCSPGGAREFIKNYENGILIPCNDVDAMANAIDFHLKNSELSIRMGNNAKKISKQLNIEVIIEHWIEMFQQIL